MEHAFSPRKTVDRKPPAKLAGVLENKKGFAGLENHDEVNEGTSRKCLKGRKRKVKQKDESSGSEEIVPRRIHFHGQARRSRNRSNTKTNEREKLDSATFTHYFMNLWSAFPEEKVKSFTYLDPLWFNLYANESSRVTVLNWIKRKGIFTKKYAFIPIVMWSHWSLLIFWHLGEDMHSKTNGPCMLLLDSLHAIGPTRLEPLIRRLLFDIHKSENRSETQKQLKKVPLLIPKMKKDWFTVEEVESFCKSLDAFSGAVSEHESASMDSEDSV